VQREHLSQKTLRLPTCCVKLCPGVLRVFLSTPLVYAAGTCYFGQYQQLLRYRKLATTSALRLIMLRIMSQKAAQALVSLSPS